jgi:phage-related protein
MEQKINVSFNVEIDKDKYKGSAWNTTEEFFNEIVISHIGKHYHAIAKSISNRDESEQKLNEGMLHTLKDLKQSIEQSIKYELVQAKDNIEELKVTFNFQYYENTIDTAEAIVARHIFNNSIHDCYFLAKEMPRMGQGAPKEKVDLGIRIYTHVGDLLTKAQKTVVISVDKPRNNKTI